MTVLRVMRFQCFNLEVPDDQLPAFKENGLNWQEWDRVEPLLVDLVEDDWRFAEYNKDLDDEPWKEIQDPRFDEDYKPIPQA